MPIPHRSRRIMGMHPIDRGRRVRWLRRLLRLLPLSVPCPSKTQAKTMPKTGEAEVVARRRSEMKRMNCLRAGAAWGVCVLVPRSIAPRPHETSDRR